MVRFALLAPADTCPFDNLTPGGQRETRGMTCSTDFSHNAREIDTCNGINFCIRYLDILPGTSAPCSDGILSLFFVAPLAWRTPKLELLHIICSGQPCSNACIRRLFLQLSGTVGNQKNWEWDWRVTLVRYIVLV
jgi:hypothetical protein